MKKPLIGALGATVALLFGGAALADSVTETWTCELKDEKTIEDVQAANSKWLAFVNSKIEGGGIKSAVGTSVVGNAEIFIFVDTYPDLATWAATKDLLDGDEGDEIGDLFDDVSECSENRLWKLEDTR